MRQPGVEPGARPWEDPMLPLHHECLLLWAQFSYHYGNSISEMYTTVALGLLYHADLQPCTNITTMLIDVMKKQIHVMQVVR